MTRKKIPIKEDYLNSEKLLKDYSPLMKSIYKKFVKFNNLFYSSDDYEDLEAQIQYEFIKLCSEYNPTRGVDFPGFIKFHLQQRVYHHITKLQKTRQKETVVYERDHNGEHNDSIDFSNTETLIDDSVERDFERVEALSCLDWSAVPGKKHKWLIEAILYEDKSIEDIAREEGVSVKIVRLRLYSACNFLIEHAKKQDEEQERILKLKQETANKLLEGQKFNFNLSDSNKTEENVVMRVPIIFDNNKILWMTFNI